MGHFTKIEYQDDWADEDTKYEDWDNKSKQIPQRVNQYPHWIIPKLVT